MLGARACRQVHVVDLIESRCLTSVLHWDATPAKVGTTMEEPVVERAHLVVEIHLFAVNGADVFHVCFCVTTKLGVH